MGRKSIVGIGLVLAVILLLLFLHNEGYVSFDFHIGDSYDEYVGESWSFEYPKGWIVYSTDGTITISGPENTEEYYVTINLQIISGGSYTSKEDAAGDIVNQLLSYDPNADVSNNILTSLGGEEAGQFDVSYTLETQDQKARYVVCEHENNFYVLSFQSPADIFSKYIHLFEHARESFVFTSSGNGGEGEKPAEGVTVSSSISYSGSSPGGLAWDGNYLYVADVGDAKIYQIYPDSGAITDSFEFTYPNGLTWDGNYLWVSDSTHGIIAKVDKSTGSVESVFDAPSTGVLGDLAWDGQYLWLADWLNDTIYRIDPSTGTLAGSISAPDDYIKGLAWDGSNLWMGDSTSGRLYKVNPSTGSVINSYSIESIGQIYGLAWDGTNLWCTSWYLPTSGASEYRICKLSIS